MKQTINKRLFMTGMVVATIAIGALAQKPVNEAGILDSVTPTANLYHDDADAKKEIEEALKSTAPTRKRILLVFGANWCYDCHVLDQALHQGEAGHIVSEDFLLVHVDIGEGEKNLDLVKLYKIPLEKGVPALAVLESDGHLLYSSGQGEFEAARRMMKKDLIQFLRHWQTQPRHQKRRRP
jgi:thiol:disulfide interchange protein